MSRKFIIIISIILVAFFTTEIFVYKSSSWVSENETTTSSALDSTKHSSLLFSGILLSGEIQGHISHGEKFQKDIGHGLVFELVPDDYGWKVVISAKIKKVNDYNFTLSTPSFHGDNPTYIQGRDFTDLVGFVPDPLNNFTRNIRDFSFVLSSADADAMAIAINNLTSGKVSDFSPDIPTGQGKLTFANTELGPIVPGQDTFIKSTDFSVDVTFPEVNKDLNPFPVKSINMNSSDGGLVKVTAYQVPTRVRYAANNYRIEATSAGVNDKLYYIKKFWFLLLVIQT